MTEIEQPTDEPIERQVRVRPFVIVRLLVCVAGTGVGAFMGLLSGIPYKVKGTMLGVPLSLVLPAILGGACGLAAGWVWCHFVVGRLYGELKNDPARPRSIFMRGIPFGVAVGTGAGVLVHLALSCATGRWSVLWPLVGALCGVVAGALTGLICSVILAVAVSHAMDDPAAAPADKAP